MAAPGNRIGKKEKKRGLYKAILLLKDEEECYSFFRDVCTIAELRAMEQRFEVARMLTQGQGLQRDSGAHRRLQRDDLARGPLADRLRRRLRAHLRAHEGREVMESYSALAASYDELTQDVGYESAPPSSKSSSCAVTFRSHRARPRLRHRHDDRPPHRTRLRTHRRGRLGGYAARGARRHGRSPASRRCFAPVHARAGPLWHGGRRRSAASTASIYLTDAREVRETFRRLHLFIAPGGSLVFDVHALGKLEAMDGQVWLDEREDVYCVWRTEYSRRSRLLDYYVDIFSARADGAGTQLRGAPPALVQRFGAHRMADRRRLRRNPRLRRLPPPRPERNRRAHLYFLYPKRVIL